MNATPAPNITNLIGQTPLLKIQSLSTLTGCEIFLKCENLNPGGSVKDRAALQMVKDAEASQALRPGMTIVEGSAGNTGIGLALVARARGYRAKIVMPRGQAQEKERMLHLLGAEVVLVDPCPFANEAHFYHTARRLAQENPDTMWWANQFENLSNVRAHYTTTGPEILWQTGGRLDYLVSVSGSGGTIGGTSKYLKENLAHVRVSLVDPEGSGLCSYVKTGQFKSTGSSITEGIGIMRLVANFAAGQVDDAITLPDRDLVTVAYHVRDHDAILLGSSSALNVAGALYHALRSGPGRRLVTFWCDGGDRSASKLYDEDFLKSKSLAPGAQTMDALVAKYRKE